MLAQIRDKLIVLGAATLGELAAELETDRESVEAALAYWRNRGEVRVRALVQGCDSGCGSCGDTADRVEPRVRGGAVTRVGTDAHAGTSSPGDFVQGFAYEWTGSGRDTDAERLG